MGIFTGAGTRVAMTSSTVSLATYTEEAFAALNYIDVGCVSEIGSFGGEAEVVEFTCLSDGVVRKLKGSKNYGELEITLALDDATEGFGVINDAFDDASSGVYAFRISYANKQNEDGTDAVRYFTGVVTSVSEEVSGADDTVSISLTISISEKVLKVNSTAGTGS